MANQVPLLKKKFLTDPEYFKKVYKFVFELGKEDGAKVVGELSSSSSPSSFISSRLPSSSRS